jgi:hypothetical protein
MQLSLEFQTIEELGLVPLDMAHVRPAAEAFRELDDSITRNFADILLTTMTILYRLYSNLKVCLAFPQIETHELC